MATPTATDPCDSSVSDTRPLTDRLEDVVETWARSHCELVFLAAEFAESPEWVLTGSPTPAHWLAIIADVESCTAREWIRIGRLLRTRPKAAVARDAWSSVAQQYADAVEGLRTAGGTSVTTEDDHVPSYEETGHTVIEELRPRCAPCHHRRHAAHDSSSASAHSWSRAADRTT